MYSASDPEGSEEEKNSMQGYITRAKMTEKAHSSLGGINVVPDEDNKKLLISQEHRGHQSSGARAPELWCPHIFFRGFLDGVLSFMLAVFQ